MAGDAPQQLLLLAVSIFCPLAWPARGGLGHHLARPPPQQGIVDSLHMGVHGADFQ